MGWPLSPLSSPSGPPTATVARPSPWGAADSSSHGPSSLGATSARPVAALLPPTWRGTSPGLAHRASRPHLRWSSPSSSYEISRERNVERGEESVHRNDDVGGQVGTRLVVIAS